MPNLNELVQYMEASGTTVSGYIESTVARKCGTCEYYSKGHCNQKDVMKDPKVKMDTKTQTKIVEPELGCCNFWEAE
jgi:hypothetical protein